MICQKIQTKKILVQGFSVFIYESKQRDSNPRLNLGKVMCFRYTMSANPAAGFEPATIPSHEALSHLSYTGNARIFFRWPAGKYICEDHFAKHWPYATRNGFQCRMKGSNLRLPACKTDTLPAELIRLVAAWRVMTPPTLQRFSRK